MPRNRREQLLAQAAARKLQTLLGSARMLQLLQQAPPVSLTEEQAALTASCGTAVLEVLQILQGIEDTGTVSQMLSALLRYHAFRSIGTLLVWVLRQPLQLQLALLQEHVVKPSTIESIWILCNIFLSDAAAAVGKLQRRSARS
jgi:hypothetical protein